MKTILTSIFVFMLACAPVAAFAQSEISPEDAQRVDLAVEMQKIRPISAEIEGTIKAVSMRLPEDRREIFVMKMMNAFDQETLNQLAIKAMADTFTSAELEKMIDFYGSPEGKSIAEKMPVYMAILRPEIDKLVDKAMMNVRLGPGE